MRAAFSAVRAFEKGVTSIFQGAEATAKEHPDPVAIPKDPADASKVIEKHASEEFADARDREASSSENESDYGQPDAESEDCQTPQGSISSQCDVAANSAGEGRAIVETDVSAEPGVEGAITIQSEVPPESRFASGPASRTPHPAVGREGDEDIIRREVATSPAGPVHRVATQRFNEILPPFHIVHVEAEGTNRAASFRSQSQRTTPACDGRGVPDATAGAGQEDDRAGIVKRDAPSTAKNGGHCKAVDAGTLQDRVRRLKAKRAAQVQHALLLQERLRTDLRLEDDANLASVPDDPGNSSMRTVYKEQIQSVLRSCSFHEQEQSGEGRKEIGVSTPSCHSTKLRPDTNQAQAAAFPQKLAPGGLIDTTAERSATFSAGREIGMDKFTERGMNDRKRDEAHARSEQVRCTLLSGRLKRSVQNKDMKGDFTKATASHAPNDENLSVATSTPALDLSASTDSEKTSINEASGPSTARHEDAEPSEASGVTVPLTTHGQTKCTFCPSRQSVNVQDSVVARPMDNVAGEVDTTQSLFSGVVNNKHRTGSLPDDEKFESDPTFHIREESDRQHAQQVTGPVVGASPIADAAPNVGNMHQPLELAEANDLALFGPDATEGETRYGSGDAVTVDVLLAIHESPVGAEIARALHSPSGSAHDIILEACTVGNPREESGQLKLTCLEQTRLGAHSANDSSAPTRVIDGKSEDSVLTQVFDGTDSRDCPIHLADAMEKGVDFGEDISPNVDMPRSTPAPVSTETEDFPANVTMEAGNVVQDTDCTTTKTSESSAMSTSVGKDLLPSPVGTTDAPGILIDKSAKFAPQLEIEMEAVQDINAMISHTAESTVQESVHDEITSHRKFAANGQATHRVVSALVQPGEMDLVQAFCPGAQSEAISNEGRAEYVEGVPSFVEGSSNRHKSSQKYLANVEAVVPHGSGSIDENIDLKEKADLAEALPVPANDIVTYEKRTNCEGGNMKPAMVHKSEETSRHQGSRERFINADVQGSVPEASALVPTSTNTTSEAGLEQISAQKSTSPVAISVKIVNAKDPTLESGTCATFGGDVTFPNVRVKRTDLTMNSPADVALEEDVAAPDAELDMENSIVDTPADDTFGGDVTVPEAMVDATNLAVGPSMHDTSEGDVAVPDAIANAGESTPSILNASTDDAFKGDVAIPDAPVNAEVPTLDAAPDANLEGDLAIERVSTADESLCQEIRRNAIVRPVQLVTDEAQVALEHIVEATVAVDLSDTFVRPSAAADEHTVEQSRGGTQRMPMSFYGEVTSNPPCNEENLEAESPSEATTRARAEDEVRPNDSITIAGLDVNPSADFDKRSQLSLSGAIDKAFNETDDGKDQATSASLFCTSVLGAIQETSDEGPGSDRPVAEPDADAPPLMEDQCARAELAVHPPCRSGFVASLTSASSSCSGAALEFANPISHLDGAAQHSDVVGIDGRIAKNAFDTPQTVHMVVMASRPRGGSQEGDSSSTSLRHMDMSDGSTVGVDDANTDNVGGGDALVVNGKVDEDMGRNVTMTVTCPDASRGVKDAATTASEVGVSEIDHHELENTACFAEMLLDALENSSDRDTLRIHHVTVSPDLQATTSTRRLTSGGRVLNDQLFLSLHETKKGIDDLLITFGENPVSRGRFVRP